LWPILTRLFLRIRYIYYYILSFVFRIYSHELESWRTRAGRRPLVLRGARQVGKSWLLQDFGRRSFRKIHRVDFQASPSWRSLFRESLSPTQVLVRLEVLTSQSFEPTSDLLILDEIQDCPEAITSLKHFHELTPDIAVCAAGSLLGVTHPKTPFPVGQVEFLDIYPMSFEEYLRACASDAQVAFYRSANAAEAIPEAIHRAMMDHLRNYLVVGGMPAVLAAWSESRAPVAERLAMVRREQQHLLDSYVGDFAKYAGGLSASLIHEVYRSIPAQLARESRRFKPGLVARASRFDRLRHPIAWLAGAGLLVRVPIVEHVEVPLSAFTDESRFKPYFFDIGLLGAMADIPVEAILLGDDLFTTFRGAYCENFVAQELRANGLGPLYAWSSGNQAEVEFLVQHAGRILPIEVKSGLSGKLRSLHVYAQRHRPAWRSCISGKPLLVHRETALLNLPLWLAGRFGDIRAWWGAEVPTSSSP
jgi:uncharacterized protein